MRCSHQLAISNKQNVCPFCGYSLLNEKDPRIVRLVSPISGTYCKLQAGEIVIVTPIPSECGTFWSVSRKVWKNSLTISNVISFVPDHKLIVEKLNN